MGADKKLVVLAALALVGSTTLELCSQTISYMTYASPAGIFKKFITTATTYLARDGGQVGIGTANPTAKLDVAGTFALRDGTQGAGKVLTSDANGFASWKAAAPDLQYLSSNCYCGGSYSNQCSGSPGGSSSPGSLSHGVTQSCGSSGSILIASIALYCPTGYSVISGAASNAGSDEAAGASIQQDKVACHDSSMSGTGAVHLACSAVCVKF